MDRVLHVSQKLIKNNRWCGKFRYSHANVNLIEYSTTYSEKTGSLWFYFKDEVADFNTDIAKASNFKYFRCKAKLLGDTVAQLAQNDANGTLTKGTIAVPLKHLTRKFIDYCKVEIKLKWSKYCILSTIGNENQSDNDDNNGNNANKINFTIKNTKLYVPVLT